MKTIASILFLLAVCGCWKPQKQAAIGIDQLAIALAVSGSTNWTKIDGRSVWTNRAGNKTIGITPTGWFFNCKF